MHEWPWACSSFFSGFFHLHLDFFAELSPDFIGAIHLAEDAESQLGVTFLEARGGASKLVDGYPIVFESHIADHSILRALTILVLTLVLVKGEALVWMESLTVSLLQHLIWTVRFKPMRHLQQPLVANCQTLMVVLFLLEIDFWQLVIGPSILKDIGSNNSNCVLGTCDLCILLILPSCSTDGISVEL